MKDTRPNIKLTSWEVHKKLKVYCAEHGLTFTEAIEKLLKEK